MFVRKRWFIAATSLLLIVLLLPLTLMAQDDELPEVVTANRPDFFPEGVEYDADGGRFLTGSLTEGTVFAITDEGEVTPLIEDADLSASIGIHIDRVNNRLLVTNSNNPAGGDPDAAPVAGLGIYDLESAERIAMADFIPLLPDAMHFINDVTSDSEGNAYASDSFAGAIYKVDLEGNAEVLVQGDLLAAEGFGVNGLEVVNDEFLLVAVSANATLIKIPLDDPTAMSEVMLPEALGGDGAVLHPNGDLIIVAGGESVALHSDDDWATATIVDRMLVPGTTTAALRDGVVYVVNPRFDVLFGSGGSVESFEITRVDLALTEMMTAGGDSANGQMLFAANCSVCHNAATTDVIVGPGMLGLAERAGSRIEGLTAEEYIRQSIMEPSVFIVEGHNDDMPPTFGQIFSDEQLDDLVAYLLTL